MSIGDYTVDLLEHDSDRGEIIGEVLTDHHNNQLYRDTYRKIVTLQRPAVLIFDSRSTVQRVFNHWHNWGVDVPGAPYESAPRLDWTRRQCREQAADPTSNWLIEDVITVTQAWDFAFGDDPAPGVDHMMSLNW